MNSRIICLASATALVLAAGVFPIVTHAQGDSKLSSLYRESYVLEAKGDYAGASAKVRDARQASGNSYFAVVRLAWLQYLAGDYAASASAYGEAVAIDPKAIEPKIGLTLPLLAAKRWKDLDRACRDVLIADPQNASARSRLAQALYWTSNYADSSAAYQKLTAEYPSNLDYKTGLAWALLKQGRTGDARQIFQAVLIVSPDNASAKEGLGVR